ncbi:MAG: hypothetical protein EHM40_11260 [Chloroflexi bacterium]|nr:MAG: hypothetical protein EHM40_11260 [Chloroflexota bacterium]
MNFDFGEVLSRAWQITWKHKVLWIIGILIGFFTSLMFPLMISPIVLPALIQNERMDLALPFLAGFAVVFLLFMLALYPLSTLAQTSLTLGVVDVQQGGERLSVSELLRRSLPFFWRALGLMLLFAAGLTLVIIIIQLIGLFLMIVTLGMGAICMAPLSFLMYPIIYGSTVWMEQAMNGIIIDNMNVMEAARHGWNLLRNNFMSLGLMALIIYFGVGMITGIVLVPMLIPVFMLPLGFLEHEVNWAIVSISVVCAAVSIPLFAILSGLSLVFTKSAWVLAYLRLTRKTGSQPLPKEAMA